MAIGKNKRLTKKGKGRKKKADAFEKKDWFRLRLPKIHVFEVDTYGWMPANKTAQGFSVTDRLYDRVCTIRCVDLKETPKADPKPEEEDVFTATNLKLRVAQTKVDERECLLDFHGMQLTRDKTCSMLKKWVTLVEATTDVKTQDGFVFRLFAIAFTKQQDNQVKKTAYAKTSQVKRLRARMIETMQSIFANLSTKKFVEKLLIDKFGVESGKNLNSILPVRRTCIRKVKLIKRPPKEDLRRITELHTKTENIEEDVEVNEME
jgi:small subunit ribosomal protein S3Ae